MRPPGLQSPDFQIADFYHFPDVFPENKAVQAAVWWLTRETKGFCKEDRKTRIDVQFVLEFLDVISYESGSFNELTSFECSKLIRVFVKIIFTQPLQ